jgi:transposase-like protein
VALAEWKQSGQSVSAFCRRRGVNKSGFYRWQRILADAGRPVSEPSPSFVPVRVVAEALAEVVLPSGLVVRVPLSADPAAVARIVGAVGGVAC